MPAELQRILGLFDQQKVSYLLFKCEHILEGKNNNLDLLLNDEDYRKAADILQEQGYVLYMDEKAEKYKKMYVQFDGKKVSAIHLHREVAWHGNVVLDKEKIFERAQGIFPSPEDSLLIHSAHALFENFKVKKHHLKYLKKYKHETANWNYINLQLSEFGWKKAFRNFVREFSISPTMIMRAYLSGSLKKPANAFNLALKFIGAAKRKISFGRKGYLIALIGMNGSGKSTTKEALLASYLPLSRFVAGQYGYYYGWKPSLLGKAITLFKKDKTDKMFDQVSEEKAQHFNLFQELLFLFVYAKFVARYFRHIYPGLRRNKLVVTDRYFYDLYGQYPYSEKSKVLSFLPIPKPDRLVVLDAEIDSVMKRDKAGKYCRVVQPREKLEGQKKRYLKVAEKNAALIINTEDDFQENISRIIKNTWKSYLK